MSRIAESRPAPFWKRLTYLLLVAVFGLITVGFNLVAAVRSFFPYRSGTPARTRRWIQFGMRLYIAALRKTGSYFQEIKLSKGNLSELRGYMVIANHPSMLDAPMLLAQIPDAICYYKASMHIGIFSNPGARMAGYIRNDAGIDGVRHAVKHLQSGGNLILFPEGTRSPVGGLGEFRSGFGLIAVQSGCPVLTLRVQNHSDILSKACPPWRCPQLPVYYLITEQSRTKALPGERAHDFARRIAVEYKDFQYVSPSPSFA